MDIAIIGGGAAGFFSAITAQEHYPSARVIIFEKSDHVLGKVGISGGGRCNVTNGCTSIAQLAKSYPRGGKALKKAFRIFNTSHTMKWFESRGVPLVIQDDNCVFPLSQNSRSIIDCFLEQAKILGIEIVTGQEVSAIQKTGEKLMVDFIKKDHTSPLPEKKQKPASFDKVVVATGGSPTRRGLTWLERLGHSIAEPVPSLFSFHMPGESITRLMGIVVENVRVNLQGTAFTFSGPLLITHWGMSGPVILKLSSFGARFLHEKNYESILQVNWVNVQNKNNVLDMLMDIAAEHSFKYISTIRPYLLPGRLWDYIIEKSGLPPTRKWGEVGKKGIHKLVSLLTNDTYQIKGKSAFKEEFVTCGGVSLESINMTTMESTVCRNLYFAGEVMDIDGITGGFNFQAAWTTGFIAGLLQ